MPGHCRLGKLKEGGGVLPSISAHNLEVLLGIGLDWKYWTVDSRSETSELEVAAMSWAGTKSTPVVGGFCAHEIRHVESARSAGRKDLSTHNQKKSATKSLLRGGDRKAVRERVSSPTSRR